MDLQKKYGQWGATVSNGLQTNATRITDDLAALVNERSQSVLARQKERLVGSGGQIARDAEALIQREPLTSDAARSLAMDAPPSDAHRFGI